MKTHTRKTCTRETYDKDGNKIFTTTYTNIDKRPWLKRKLNIE
jgi:hypothetical protein